MMGENNLSFMLRLKIIIVICGLSLLSVGASVEGRLGAGQQGTRLGNRNRLSNKGQGTRKASRATYQERRHVAQHPTSMPADTPASTISLVLDSLLDRIDPHREPVSATVQTTQRLCGEWILWQRVQQGISSAAVAQHTGITESVLAIMELGLAREENVDARACHLLASLLADRRYPEVQVMSIINLATSRVDTIDTGLLESIRQDVAKYGC